MNIKNGWKKVEELVGIIQTRCEERQAKQMKTWCHQKEKKFQYLFCEIFRKSGYHTKYRPECRFGINEFYGLKSEFILNENKICFRYSLIIEPKSKQKAIIRDAIEDYSIIYLKRNKEQEV